MPNSPNRVLRWVASAAACLLLLAGAAPALAQCQKTTLADLEDEVMCEQCGVPLALATDAPQAKAERAFIRDLIAQCRTKEEIKDALRAEFGPGVLAVPDDDGFGIAAYLVPALALLAGSVGVAVAVRRWRRTRAAEATAGPAGGPPEPDAAEAARLDEELRRFDR